MRTLSLILLLFVVPSLARAESWCAYPLWVHEWGVQAFDAQGRATTPVPLPTWFHRSVGARAGAASGTPVRRMAADSGMRALPVLHFYSGGSLSSPIPIGIEVGFAEGDASVWYPQVDSHRSAAHANLPVSRAQRAQLLAQRQAELGFGTTPVPRDWTRQLFWDRLELSASPARPAHRSTTPWVNGLRDFDRALWVNGARESERFVFYEADTREQVALTIERGDQWRAGHRHIVLRNRGTHSVFDVVLTHREGRNVFVVHAPAIPAGRSAGFVLDDHPASASRGRTLLRAALVDAAQPSPPTQFRLGSRDQCTMMRDPAVPVETSEGHQLYAHEVDAILDIWGASLFDQPGTTVAYREDVAYLDAMMPLSIYTDMFNFVLLRRAGLAVWSNVSLP